MTGSSSLSRTVAGWDDPRLFTISGLRKRGVPLGALNEFLDSIPVTRRGNDNFIQMAKFDHVVKGYLDKVCPRMMAVSDPVAVKIVNSMGSTQYSALSFPAIPSKGSYSANLSSTVYLERSDFSGTTDTSEDNQRGITVGSLVRLKYGPMLRVTKVSMNESNSVTKATAEIVEEIPDMQASSKPKVVNWVSKEDATPCQLKLYEQLFLVEKPSQPADDPQQRKAEVNPRSLRLMSQAVVNKSVLDQIAVQGRYQFERLGYFSLDQDQSDIGSSRLVFNRIIESQSKKHN